MNNEVFKKKKTADEAEVIFIRSKDSFKKVCDMLKGYTGKKIPAKKFNALSQPKKIEALKSMGDEVFAGCKLISCLDKRHEDSHPSMGYSEELHGFYCFSCGRSCDLIDLVGAVYMRLKFVEKYAKAVELFVEPGGDKRYRHTSKDRKFKDRDFKDRDFKDRDFKKCKKTSTYNNELEVIIPQSKPKSEFLPKPMWYTLKNKHYIPLSDDHTACRRALTALQYRGFIDPEEIAERFHLRAWEYNGTYYLVFVNDDGSVCRRFIGGGYTDTRWWNSKNGVGVFNERALDCGDVVFVCEGCFDALTVMYYSKYKAVSVNSVSNLKKITRHTGIKPILLTDNDATGREAARQMSESTGFFVPDFLKEGYSGDSYLAKYKDINEAASLIDINKNVALKTSPDFKALRAEIKRLYSEAERYYSRKAVRK